MVAGRGCADDYDSLLSLAIVDTPYSLLPLLAFLLYTRTFAYPCLSLRCPSFRFPPQIHLLPERRGTATRECASSAP